LLRARPIFSSIVQAAGRANRHGEAEPAEVLVFPFIRDDGKDPRRLVYRGSEVTRFTDAILDEAPEIADSDVARWLESYYRRCWEANPHTTSLQHFEAAARGQWSKLAENEPFQEDLPGLDVFIPGAERFLPRRFRRLLGDFGVGSA